MVISVHQVVLDVKIEQTVSLANSAVKLYIDIKALDPGAAEESSRVIDNDAQFSSLGPVVRIQVLDTDFSTKQFK